MRRRSPCVVALSWLILAAPPAFAQTVAPRAPIAGPSASRILHSYRVLRVVDGDTVVLRMDGRSVKCRLIGVDTPETVHPTRPVERFGREASAFLKGLVQGKEVAVDFEPGVSRVDRYGRLLVYLYLEPGGGAPRVFVNREIVARGYGHAYTTYPFRYMEDFRAAERAAREGRLGLWAPGPGTSRDESASTTAGRASAVGTCGAPTKAGGACRRRVKGGGYCYQHR